MEVSSVTSSATSFTSTQSAKTEQPVKAERSEPAPEPTQETRAEERTPAPVVNTQGQKVGQIINTSA